MGVYILLPVVAGMGVVAGIAVIAVLICRCFLRRGPKLFCYLLWSVVLFRLLCPVSVPSALSVLRLFDFGRIAPQKLEAQTVQTLQKGLLQVLEMGNENGNRIREIKNVQDSRFETESGESKTWTDKMDFSGAAPWYADDFITDRFFDLRLAWENRFYVSQYPAREEKQEEINDFQIIPKTPALLLEMGVPGEEVLAESAIGNAPAEKNAVSDKKTVPVWLAAATWVWLAGIGGMLLYAQISLFRIRRRLVGAVRLKENIYQSDYITSPFVMGVFAPKIYLPSALCGKERKYILLHEQTHIKRGDYIFRLLAFTALALHWFNPLVWLAFWLSGQDMEMACDEAVMKKMKEDIRAEYSASLLGLAAGRHLIPGTYLAFGEGDVKGRIKNVMRYKKPTAFWVVFAAFLVSGTVCVFGSDPKEAKEVPAQNGQKQTGMAGSGEALYNGVAAGLCAAWIETPGTQQEVLNDFLTVYSLSDSELVRELIAGFVSRCPQIEIRYETGEEGLSVMEQIDALTARLSAGMGPDLLILDGLPAQIYQSKGLLTDLAPALEPFKEELQPDILSACTQDGKVYMLPICYLLPVVLADEAGQEAAQSPRSWMQYAAGEELENIGINSDSYTDLIELLYYNYMPELLLPDGSANEQELAAFLRYAKALADSAGSEGGKEAHSSFSESLYAADFAAETEVRFAVLRGSEDLRRYFDPTEEMPAQGTELALLDGVFFPEGLIGMNAWSPKKELASRFVQEIFSSSMQSECTPAGFWINVEAYPESSLRKGESAAKELAGKLEEIVAQASRCQMADAAALQILEEEAAGYFHGEKALSDCVAAIVQRIE